MSRLARIDHAVATIDLVDADDESLPTPGHAPARMTDEGYLIVDALIARDGVLKYSNGSDEWLEYRPRAELERAANGWLHAPVTDNHPSAMVDAKTWAKVARGTHVAVCGLVDIDGTAYLHARLQINDAALVRDIVAQHERGKPVELSIGFTSEVHDEAGTHLGQSYVAVQRGIIANHTAKVDAGRAGPACRVLFDGVACPVYDQGVDMTIKNAKPGSGKNDDAGSQTATTMVPDPVTGEPVALPTWAAAALQELATLKGGAPAPAPAPAAPPMAQPPAAPAMPSANAAPPAQPPAPAPAMPGAPIEKPEDKREGKGEEPEESEDEKMSDKDRKESVSALVRARRKLERDAERCGVDEDTIATADDVDLKRAIVKSRIPAAKIDKLDGAPLDAFVEAALAIEAPKGDRPWGLGAPKRDASDKSKERIVLDDADALATAEALKAMGY